MNECRNELFNDTPAWKLLQLLGVRHRNLYEKVDKKIYILKIHKKTHGVKSCAK